MAVVQIVAEADLQIQAHLEEAPLRQPTGLSTRSAFKRLGVGG